MPGAAGERGQIGTADDAEQHHGGRDAEPRPLLGRADKTGLQVEQDIPHRQHRNQHEAPQLRLRQLFPATIKDFLAIARVAVALHATPALVVLRDGALGR